MEFLIIINKLVGKAALLLWYRLCILRVKLRIESRFFYTEVVNRGIRQLFVSCLYAKSKAERILAQGPVLTLFLPQDMSPYL